MSKRLRFVKTEVESVLVTKTPVESTTHGLLNVTINSGDLTYYINKNADNENLDSGQAKDLPALKKVVKMALAELGVVFEKESRTRVTTNEA